MVCVYVCIFVCVSVPVQRLEENWRGGQPRITKINCRSEISKGVYCLQYDEKKIVSGQRDNTIRIWDRANNYELQKSLLGHTGSVLCLQYDGAIIVSGSSDSTVRSATPALYSRVVLGLFSQGIVAISDQFSVGLDC